MVARIWTSATLEKAKPGIAFDFAPEPCASLDAAFDGDDCVFTLADLGKTREGIPCMCARSSEVIKVQVGPDSPEKDIQIARECIRRCKENRVKPENFIMDTTGNARGVYAIMRNEWTPGQQVGIQKCYYGGEATDRPLRLNDPLTAAEQVKYFVAELWFRASYLAREGMLCGLSALDDKTIEDLSSRRYTIKQIGDRKLMVAETKPDMKKRLNRSPDRGDALCQLGELMALKGLLGDVKIAGGKKADWTAMRERAKKASARYLKEFSSS